MHGDMEHEAVPGGAVPVVFARFKEDAVAGANDLNRAAFALAETDTLGDVDGLSVGVRVPGGPGARRELAIGRSEGRAAGRSGNRVYIDVAREPVRRPFLGFNAGAGDLHGIASLYGGGRSSGSWGHHHLDRLARGHRPVPSGTPSHHEIAPRGGNHSSRKLGADASAASARHWPLVLAGAAPSVDTGAASL